LSWKKEFMDRITQETAAATINEDIDYKRLINHQILECLVADDYEFEGKVRRLLSMIPEGWKDQKFREELEQARYETEVKIPVKFAGITVVNNPNIPTQTQRIEAYDWEKIFEACINLFDRVGLLLKKIKKEIWMGIKFDDARKMARQIMMQNIDRMLPDEVAD